VDAAPVVSDGADESQGVDVLIGRLDDLVATGLAEVLRTDRRLRVLASNTELAGHKSAYGGSAPQVVIVNEEADRLTSESSIEPGGGIVMLTHAPTVPQGIVLLEAGISCLALSVVAEDLLAAVWFAARGGCLFVSGTRDRFGRPDRRQRVLTERELEVLHRLSGGAPYREIARELEISVATVNKHAQSLIQKLHGSSKRDLKGLPTTWLERREGEFPPVT
jgi:DNA-binding NarL/FixJ family response regulator